MSGNFYLHLLAGVLLVLASASRSVAADDAQQPKTYKWFKRVYNQNTYVQYIVNSTQVRYLTWKWDPDQGMWTKDVPKDVAESVQSVQASAEGYDADAIPFNNFSLNAVVTVRERLYILDTSNVDRILVTDPVAGTVLARANLAFNRPVALATSPISPFIYVTHQAEAPGGFFPAHPAGISVFDKRTNQVVKHQPLPDTVTPSREHLALSPDGSRLYMVNTNGFTDPSSIEVYDAITLARVASIPAPAGSTYQEVAVSPDGSMLCATRSDSRIALIDALTSTVSAVLFMGSPSAPVFHPDGTRIFVSRRNQIAIIDTASATLTATMPIPGSVEMSQLAVTADGFELFANDKQARTLFVIDTNTFATSQTLESFPGSELLMSK